MNHAILIISTILLCLITHFCRLWTTKLLLFRLFFFAWYRILPIMNHETLIISTILLCLITHFVEHKSQSKNLINVSLLRFFGRYFYFTLVVGNVLQQRRSQHFCCGWTMLPLLDLRFIIFVYQLIHRFMAYGVLRC